MLEAMPLPVLRRLTKYLTHIRALRENGVEWISSQELANKLGLTSSTVRSDLSYINCTGISKRGYPTACLEKMLIDVLAANQRHCVVIVGAGNLGRALALHEDFPRQGFDICALFDINPGLIGTKIGRLTVEPLERLTDFVRTQNVDIGIVAVPPNAAQETADRLVAAGVRGILNLTSKHVQVPENVPVVEAHIVTSLRELSFRIRSQGTDEESPGGSSENADCARK